MSPDTQFAEWTASYQRPCRIHSRNETLRSTAARSASRARRPDPRAAISPPATLRATRQEWPFNSRSGDGLVAAGKARPGRRQQLGTPGRIQPERTASQRHRLQRDIRSGTRSSSLTAFADSPAAAARASWDSPAATRRRRSTEQHPRPDREDTGSASPSPELPWPHRRHDSRRPEPRDRDKART